MEVISFKEALALARQISNRHVLLGNGFSQAIQKDVFDYEALFKNANFSKLAKGRKAFEALDTCDFEAVMNALCRASLLLKVYDPHSSLIDQMESDADELRKMLANAIADGHPAKRTDIDKKRYRACEEFLSNFGQIYTLNYDLLLYWTVMQYSQPLDDGFRGAPLVWKDSETEQKMFYLHGALHLFDHAGELVKLKYESIPLIEQIQTKLKENWFPLMVAGTKDQKRAKIRSHPYLRHCYSRFAHLEGALFLYGVSLGEGDDLILKSIAESHLTHLFVSIYGDPESDDNKRTENRANEIVHLRTSEDSERKLCVWFFNAITANVWGEASQ